MWRPASTWAIWLTLSAAAGATASQKPLSAGNGPLTKEFGDFVLERLKEWHVPGLAIGVVDGDKVYTEGYGIATFPSEKVTPSTLFMAGSTSKAFTAATLAMLIDSGNYSVPLSPLTAGERKPVSWSTPVSHIVPDDFVLNDEWATNHITLNDAASHRSGMPRHDKAMRHHYGAGKDRHVGSPKDVTRQLRHLPLSYEPRSTYQYCNLMFGVLAHVIETLTGGWAGHATRELIWKPLGMHSTYYNLEEALAAPEPLAGGYAWDEENEEYIFVTPMKLDEISGAGSVTSNVLDYTKWIKCWITESGPLSKNVHKEARTPRTITIVEPGPYPFDTIETYGLGWRIMSYKGHRLIAHSGGMDAYGTELFIFPDLKYGIVTFANTAGSSNAVGEIVLWHLVDELLNIAEEDRYDWAKKWRTLENRMKTSIANAVEITYPNHASLPAALPFEAYAGTYYHPGYGNMTLELPTEKQQAGKKEIKLVAYDPDTTWRLVLRFEHVSGEYWVMYSNLHGAEKSQSYAIADVFPAQFKIGADGKVAQLAVRWHDFVSEISDGYIWYDKIAE